MNKNYLLTITSRPVSACIFLTDRLSSRQITPKC